MRRYTVENTFAAVLASESHGTHTAVTFISEARLTTAIQRTGIACTVVLWQKI